MYEKYLLQKKGITFTLFSILFSLQVSAFVPKATTILQKTAENNGNGIYQIEQEVTFPNNFESVTLKETWIIENENTFKLIVSGTKELQDSIYQQFSYNFGQRTGVGVPAMPPKKATEDFIEKYFHIRTTDNYINLMLQLKILPLSSLSKKTYKNTKEMVYEKDPYVNLARVGGTISYALGEPTPAEGDTLNPEFWIEQDQFNLKKFRLPSKTEVTAEQYSVYARGFNFPKTRTVHWKNNLVTIQTLSVTAKTAKVTLNPKASLKFDLPEDLAAKPIIQEFYNLYR